MGKITKYTGGVNPFIVHTGQRYHIDISGEFFEAPLLDMKQGW
jgi:UDP-N-acetylglucosamine 2-epimerase